MCTRTTVILGCGWKHRSPPLVYKKQLRAWWKIKISCGTRRMSTPTALQFKLLASFLPGLIEFPPGLIGFDIRVPTWRQCIYVFLHMYSYSLLISSSTECNFFRCLSNHVMIFSLNACMFSVAILSSHLLVEIILLLQPVFFCCAGEIRPILACDWKHRLQGSTSSPGRPP